MMISNEKIKQDFEYQQQYYYAQCNESHNFKQLIQKLKKTKLDNEGLNDFNDLNYYETLINLLKKAIDKPSFPGISEQYKEELNYFQRDFFKKKRKESIQKGLLEKIFNKYSKKTILNKLKNNLRTNNRLRKNSFKKKSKAIIINFDNKQPLNIQNYSTSMENFILQLIEQKQKLEINQMEQEYFFKREQIKNKYHFETQRMQQIFSFQCNQKQFFHIPILTNDLYTQFNTPANSKKAIKILSAVEKECFANNKPR